MSVPPASLSAVEPLRSALTQVQRRMRLNRLMRVGAIGAGLALTGALAWILLERLGGRVPAASALVILLAILALVGLALLLVRALLQPRPALHSAAALADQRAGLKNELLSALWFAREPRASDWVEMQLQRAGRRAAGLQPARLVPLRLPGVGLGALALGVLALVAALLTPPLGAGPTLGADVPAPEALKTLREMAAAMPQSEAARELEQALEALERPDATPEERRKAMAQAQDAVDRMGLEAASAREELQKLSESLGSQPGMEQVAEALAKGDAARAAQLLDQMQKQNPSRDGAGGSDSEPVDAGPNEQSPEQALLEATQATGAQQDSAPSKESVQAAIDRLNEIAKELSASNYVNEAWQSVRGPQLEQYQQAGGMTAGRYAEQTQASSMPSPGSGETPMTGGTMARSAAVAQGDARTEQEGGTRMGDALGESQADPVLGKSEERLEAQLQQSAIESENRDESAGEERTWYYAESQQQKSLVSRREVQARTRFAQAEAGGNGGISIQHRQIVKDYFMNLRESAR